MDIWITYGEYTLKETLLYNSDIFCDIFLALSLCILPAVIITLKKGRVSWQLCKKMASTLPEVGLAYYWISTVQTGALLIECVMLPH